MASVLVWRVFAELRIMCVGHCLRRRPNNNRKKSDDVEYYYTLGWEPRTGGSGLIYGANTREKSAERGRPVDEQYASIKVSRCFEQGPVITSRRRRRSGRVIMGPPHASNSRAAQSRFAVNWKAQRKSLQTLCS